MSKVKINDKFYSVMDLTIESIERDSLGFDNDTGLVIVFNETATKIWAYLKEASVNNGSIHIAEISRSLMDEYNIGDEMFDTIHKDVSDILSDFVKNKILNEI